MTSIPNDGIFTLKLEGPHERAKHFLYEYLQHGGRTFAELIEIARERNITGQELVRAGLDMQLSEARGAMGEAWWGLPQSGSKGINIKRYKRWLK